MLEVMYIECAFIMPRLSKNYQGQGRFANAVDMATLSTRLLL